MVTDMPPSNLEKNRQGGKHQIAGRRDSILEAAESLFLQKGLENTSMVDIASQAGITKVTLYRYFPDRNPIAFEIAVRMLRKIAASAEIEGRDPSLENLRGFALAMIENFHRLRDAYRYIGMFDHLYGDRYPSERLAGWYKNQMIASAWGRPFFQGSGQAFPQRKPMVMIFNTVMSYLEKMAARGELTSADGEVPLDEQLSLFKTMVAGYFDRLMEAGE